MLKIVYLYGFFTSYTHTMWKRECVYIWCYFGHFCPLKGPEKFQNTFHVFRATPTYVCK